MRLIIPGAYFVLILIVLEATSALQRFVAASEKLPWKEALNYCEKRQMSLPELEGKAITEMLAIKAREHVVIHRDTSWNRIWLAANRFQSLDFYQGETDAPVFYTNFDSRNGAFMEGNCVEMYLRQGNTFKENWATDHCEEPKRFFCMIL